MQCFYRSNRLNVLLCALLSLAFPLWGLGKNSLDDLVFLTCETQSSVATRLHEGYRAFILLPETPVKTVLNEANDFFNENKEELISFIVKSEVAGFLEELEQNEVCQFLAIPGEHSLDNLAECKTRGKRLFVFTPENTPLSFSIENQICEYNVPSGFPSEIVSGFIGKPENDLVIYQHNHVLNNLADSLKLKPELVPQLFNSYTGKLPNFFVTKNRDVFADYYQVFESKNWYSASVEYNGMPLAGISWKDMPQLVSFGKIHTTKNDLSPYKNGYHFSPDVFNFNRQTSESTKIFYATQKNLKDEMVLFLRFEQRVVNAVGEETEIPYSNIEYKKDSSRGWCAVFNGRDNYIDFDTDIIFDENFTVSAWVKPSEIDGNRSIIGKGKALSIKFRDGEPLFTAPGIKDHVLDSAVVTPGEWQHLTYVISSGEVVRFYRNGELAGTQKAEIIQPTEHSLLIGTNLWDESFKGMMDDLAIWDRNLSDDEVRHLYIQGTGNENKSREQGQIGWAAILGVFLLLLFLFFRKRKKGQNKPAKKAAKNINHSVKEQPEIKVPSIELFGGFKIVNRNEEDLTARFSPRRKQIFVLVLIETLKEKGISSKKLTNFLWAGYPPGSAKNNRSTQVQRIREILARVSGIEIAYNNKKWVMNLEPDVYCDLAEYFSLTEQFKKSQENVVDYDLLVRILSIIEKGTLLPNMDDEWLDEFKSNLSDDLLEMFLPLFSNEAFMSNSEMVLQVSRALLIFDPLNETILKHKISSLVKLGKNTQAHECLEHFEKIYLQCYGESFKKSFSDLI